MTVYLIEYDTLVAASGDLFKAEGTALLFNTELLGFPYGNEWKEVSLVYFRTAYAPRHYRTQKYVLTCFLVHYAHVCVYAFTHT